MRRRISAPALALNRHSLPRLAIDSALVALAYFLAFQLRFDNGPTGHYDKLLERTVWWVLAGSLVVLLLSRVYQRRWRYSGQRDYEAVARAVIAIVLLTVVAVAIVRPVQIPHQLAHRAAGAAATNVTVTVGLPNGVIALFFLLSLLLLIGVRVVARSLYERRPFGGFRPGGRGERNVLIVGAGDGGRLVLREILRTIRASAGCGSTA
jgi:FlaA1/EpsC-like NDP-sugar epimerase